MGFIQYNMPMKSIIYTILLLLYSCSGIKMLNGPKRSDLYTPAFIAQVNGIKASYNNGNDEIALQKLMGIREEGLLPAEKALRRNLIGVINFSRGNFEKAIYNFNQAMSFSSEDESLNAQIKLNLSSSYFKISDKNKAYENLINTNFENLKGNDFISYHKLRYHLAAELGNKRDIVVSLFHSLSDKNEISTLKSDPLYEVLKSRFAEMSRSEKNNILTSLEDKKTLVVGYTGFLEGKDLYYSGDKSYAQDVLSWVDDNFTSHGEIKSLIKNFTYRIENDTQINPNLIGVVLPLSGDKKAYGERALLGIDSSLRNLKKENMNLRILIRDSKGSAAVGAKMTKDLIDNESVAVVIGGLFSDEALKEYEVSKKRGTFFISLSEVYTSKDHKDHLLLEVPGSVESQINHLFSEQSLNAFGKKGAIIYPRSRRGKAYVNEFWRKAKSQELPVAGVYSYSKDKKDFNDPVRNLLGLKYVRPRQEEFDIWSEIYSLESKRRSVRRIQVLKPQTDFDWVFIPSVPIEAIQIIPSFNYFDAYNVKLIGGPSWRSKRLSRESYKYKGINFIGEDVTNVAKSMRKNFYNNYERNVGVIELRAIDGMNMAFKVIENKSYESRDELDRHIKGMTSLSGVSGSWNLTDGVWIKKMTGLHFERGKISSVETSTVTQ